MSFFKKKYKVKGWNGDTHSLTAKALYERVLEDSKSDYNWIASATELVRVCNDPCFPEMYSVGIKLIILNCFANLETKKEKSNSIKKWKQRKSTPLIESRQIMRLFILVIILCLVQMKQ